jgi:hypothetical protein
LDASADFLLEEAVPEAELFVAFFTSMFSKIMLEEDRGESL